MLGNVWMFPYDNMDKYLFLVGEHIYISLIALATATVVSVALGVVSYKRYYLVRALSYVTGLLRVIPSLAVIFLMIPFLKTGFLPATVAIVLLGIPPIYINTVMGLSSLPHSILETAKACGMSDEEIYKQITFPLALPLILNGIKIASIEIVASTALAAKIGAGGLGEMIFAGLGLNRYDLLVWGAVTITCLAYGMNIFFSIMEKKLIPYETRRNLL